MPAGLIDAGETPEQAAERELKEETGYVGKASESSPIMYNGQRSPIYMASTLPVLPSPSTRVSRGAQRRPELSC